MINTKQQFEDLIHSLRLLQVNNHQIPKPQLYAFMRALETGSLKLNYQHQVFPNISVLIHVSFGLELN